MKVMSIKVKKGFGISRTRMKAAIAEMPPMDHWPLKEAGVPFDIMASEVMKWMVKQPEVMDFLFDVTRGTKMIRYDGGSGTWVGIGWVDGVAAEVTPGTT